MTEPATPPAPLPAANPAELLRGLASPRQPPPAPSAPTVARPGPLPSPAADPGGVRIGLWGGVGSGKTTFVGALQIAVDATNLHKAEADRWTLEPQNDVSAQYMARAQAALGGYSNLESATYIAQDLAWTLRGRLPNAEGVGEFVKVDFRVRDVPGGHYLLRGTNEGQAHDPAHTEETIRYLADADGLVYLFDPMTEQRQKDSAEYFINALSEIGARTPDARRGDHALLPHHLAVCTVKLDDTEVFRLALRAGLVETGSDGLPRVPDDLAEEFFRRLCTDTGLTSAQHISNAIGSRFRRDRVSYFVSSALGFSSAARPGLGTGAPDRLGIPRLPNLVEAEGGGWQVTDPATPINVFEPVLTLISQVWASRGDAGSHAHAAHGARRG